MIELVVNQEPPKGLKSKLRQATKAVMQHYNIERRSITVVLTGDEEIRALKKEHWGEDQATDVLTFPTWHPDDPFMPPHLGDIVVSLDTAARQAEARGHTLTREVALLVSHGLTHIMGFDHPHSEDFGFDETTSDAEWQPFIVASRIAYDVVDQPSIPAKR
ncbi:rRNA maturation RNase YbeY [Deinococcus cellulosilyticus]|uniref:Endoribonuclease YbeY n=1 Tax=Deinococcus cellulosilyticus (strain DSM 18568 / NBRC 106333 / KACC 11606 / 5516J-15) TaxID=1223518 RepID=A0A511N647_DEIC1|nr:rRNA maturation RNase YbeY [Deinococcus cellulosilyticus]GEM47906.1 endoribonuclease YbeY [Deinococcus cellulosilyticus NBRC 106333 = KACC 11606]